MSQHCLDCGIEQSIENTYPHPRHRDRLRTRCKKCQCKYNYAHLKVFGKKKSRSRRIQIHEIALFGIVGKLLRMDHLSLDQCSFD